MAFRTILIEKAKQVNLDLNSIIIHYEEEKFIINLDEISTILFDDPRCYISLKLLSKLCEKGISVIFTDHSHCPVGQLVSYNIHSRAPQKLNNQICWQDKTKRVLWTKIVEQKIKSQIVTLRALKKKDKLDIMINYIKEIKENDSTNREGLASRTYFKELFGEDFKRFSEEIINYCLNYTYQLFRSKIAQQISLSGYSTELGINHRSEYNSFNLADDFIEVYRPIIDYYVYLILYDNKESYLTPELKRKLVNIMNENVIYNNQNIKGHISIQFYIQNMFSFLETGDMDKIIFPLLS